MPDPLEEMGRYSHMMAYVDEHSFQSRLHRWRFNLKTGEEQVYRLPEGVYASESPMIPRKGAVSEDDGYLVTFLIDENTGTSQCAILDASDVARGPICRLALPHKICSGTHSVWVEHEQLRKDAAFHRARYAAA